MPYQFAHIDSYARRGSTRGGAKHSAREIAAEAMREDGACPHVDEPKPPTVLYGSTPADAVADAEAWAEGTRDAKGRKYRADGLCLLAGVVSMKAGDPKGWAGYKVAVVEHLRAQFGDRLRSVVEHTDEAHPHLHFYAVPLPGERFDDIHPGRKAAAAVAARGEVKGQQNRAYCEAMRDWQDDLYRSVSWRFGLTRLGPGRRRLSRSGWHAEEAQAEAFAQVERITTEAHRRGWSEGKAEGIEAGRAEAKAEAAKPLARVGDAVGGLAARVAGRWHKPTKQAEADAQKARKRAAKAKADAEALENRRKALESVLSSVNRDLDTANAVAKAAKAEAAEAKAENEALRARLDRLRPDPSRAPGFRPAAPRV